MSNALSRIRDSFADALKSWKGTCSRNKGVGAATLAGFTTPGAPVQDQAGAAMHSAEF
jgi:hypothetical protein